MSHHDSLRLPPLDLSRQTPPFNYLLPSLSQSRATTTRLPSISAPPLSAQPPLRSNLPPLQPIARRPQPIKKTVPTRHGLREVYACPFENCARTSTEHSNLKAHMRMHTGERPYTCSAPGCRRNFRWKSSLTYHEKAIHTSVKPYKCSPCRKQFVEKRKYKMHLEMCPYSSQPSSGTSTLHRAVSTPFHDAR